MPCHRLTVPLYLSIWSQGSPKKLIIKFISTEVAAQAILEGNHPNQARTLAAAQAKAAQVDLECVSPLYCVISLLRAHACVLSAILEQAYSFKSIAYNLRASC